MGRFKLLAVGLLIVSSTGVAWAQERGGTWASRLFSERGIDFGPVPRGAKVRHNFILQNNLNELVNILSIQASCGCTTGRPSATAVPPGATAVIEAEMDTRNFVGPKATVLTVMLMTASGKEGSVQFGVKSNILADIVLNPGSADFGAVGRGQAAKQVITIERLGNPAWKITRMMASDALCRIVKADLTETHRNAQGVGYQLLIQLKPEATPGYLREEIRLVTNDSESSLVPVLVTAQVRGTLQVSPANLALGTIQSSSQVQAKFLVKGDRPFAIDAIEGNGDGFTLSTADPNPKTLHILNLSFKPEQATRRGDIRQVFRVRTSLPDEPPLELTTTLRLEP